MAKLAVPLLILLFFPSFISSQAALPLQTTIQKDRSTSQYVITAYLQTPLKLTKFLLDLGSTYTWVNCDDYTSSTSIASLLGPYACLDLCDGPPSPNCGNNSFLFLPDNPIKPIDYRKVNGLNTALIDPFALPNAQGSLTLINNFIFSCARTGFLKGLAKGITGLAALGRSNISIPEAASSAFNLTTTKPVKPFAVCYPASAVKNTQVGPAVPIIDLVLDRQDVVWKIFGSNSMVRITKKSVDLWCLGFLDAGVNQMVSSWVGAPSIVIGGYQLEDNMLQFDLQSKKLGFSSSILSKGTDCAKFKFPTKRV
ncbi:ASPARTYL PROTEASE-RELATED [Salix purpurea]|uniref:ASPARTYL PROTEASE-RELATED n=1 Tax=Salix purpurea TaxID=77065 RepID=A0A9Q0V9V6_SALPP|nr:ASPARTYL PROTEASE-RELATED [Salix purpurea]